MIDYPRLDSEASDTELEQVLETQLAVPALSPEATERVRASVAQAWAQACTPPRVAGTPFPARSWGRWVALTAAASLAAVAVTYFALRAAGHQELMGSLARSPDGGVERTVGMIWHRALEVGDPLRVGDTLTARGPALVALAEGGTLRLGSGSVVGIETVAQLTLERGKIYVDVPPGITQSQPLRVTTRLGLVEHLGTQFEAADDHQDVRVRVREGQVRFSGATGVLVAHAGTELRASSGGKITQQPILTFGHDWQWAAALAPDFAVEGRSLKDYLLWVSRELGRPLVFSDARARESAERTILHGSVRSEATLDALAEVLSSTSLTYELADGAIRIHSAQ